MIRLFVRFFVGMLLALLAAAAIGYWLLRYPPGQPQDSELTHAMQIHGKQLVVSMSAIDESRWQQLLDNYNEGSAFVVSHFSLDRDELEHGEWEMLSRGEPLHFNRDQGGPSLWFKVPDRDALVDIGPREPLVNPYPADLLIASSAVLVVIGVFGLLLVLPVVHRIKSLEKAARAFGQGEWNTRADDRYADSIGDLASTLNRMASEIQQLLQDQQELLQAVAHEFRAPLSRLGFALENAREATTERERVEEFDGMQQAVEALGELVVEVLGYARLQPGNSTLDIDRVALSQIVDQVVEEQCREHPNIEINASATAPRPFYAEVDAGYFHRVLHNLVSNAARHAHHQVCIDWGIDHERFWLCVDDDGLGIPHYRRNRVFEPFTRLDESRSRRSGGVGLGLAIVRRISHKHGGEVTAEDSPMSGARFRLLWPHYGGCAKQSKLVTQPSKTVLS